MRCDGFEVFFVSWCDMWKTGLVWSGRLAKSKLEFSQRLTQAAWFGLAWCTSVCTQSLLWLLQTAIECSNRPDVCTLELYIAQQLIQRAMRSGGLSISLWQTYYSLSLNALLTQWTRFVTPLIGRGWLEMGVLRNMKYENGGNQRSRAAPQIRRVLSRPKNDRFWRVFHPIRPFFLHFHPFHAHTKPILQKNQVWLAFFGRGGGSKFLPQLREGCHRLLNWQIQISKSWK